MTTPSFNSDDLRGQLLRMTPQQVRAFQAKMDPGLWATDTAKLSLPKGPFSFNGRNFIRQVYRDTADEVVVIKGAQLGFSTMSIIRALWAVTTFPLSVIYTFPTQGNVSTFTAARINPIIASSPYLRERIQQFDSVGLKQFARIPKEEQRRLAAAGLPIQFSTIYFNGAQNRKDATSVDADLLIHDEEDRSDPQTIEEYQSRLYASKYKWMVRLSTPTYPGMGIDRQWQRTDMRRWLIKCDGCNNEFEMDFPANIEPDTYDEAILKGITARFKCARCGRTITEDQRQGGRWVAERPNIPSHGYSISQMSALGTALGVLDQFKKATFPGAFWNLVMARPWQEGTSAMTREAILARQDENVVGEGNVYPRYEDGGRGLGCTMGVDVGKFLDVVIGITDRGIPRTIEMKRLGGDSKWDDLSELMIKYGIVNCVIDSQPEDHMAHQFANKWAGRVYRCRYSDGRVKELKFDAVTHSVSAPRTEILTASSIELLTKRILPRYDGSEAYEAFIKHHENSKRVPIYRTLESMDISIASEGMGEETVDRERMVDFYEWRETGPDHLFHASTYEMMARLGYHASVGLPSNGFVSINRFKIASEREARPLSPNTPLLLPTAGMKARRRH